jgi:multidrug efflux pump subunit AcrA (membrane-fusion protein)
MSIKSSNHRRKRWLFGLILVVAGGGFGAVKWWHAAPTVPTAEIKLGEFVDYFEVRGDLKALRSVTLSAPPISGDLQIIKLARNGSQIKSGDLVAQFDTTTLQRTLDQKRSEVKEANAEIDRSRAQGHLLEEQNLTAVMKARYDVERARLEVSKQEIVSKIEGEKSKLSLANAEQKLKEAEEKLKSDRAANVAEIASKQQKRDKALFEQNEAERNIAAMTLKAPLDGTITVLPNYGTRWWGNAAEFKEGDRAWPGAPIAELPDISNIRLAARIDETDRGKLQVHQTATVRVEALPDKDFVAKVVEISAIAKPDFSSWPVNKSFDFILQLEQTDARIRPGMSASARVGVERLPNSVLAPVNGSFQKAGRLVAYLLRSGRFEERVIEVSRRNKEQLVIAKGLKPGDRVALKDPTLEGQAN